MNDILRLFLTFSRFFTTMSTLAFAVLFLVCLFHWHIQFKQPINQWQRQEPKIEFILGNNAWTTENIKCCQLSSSSLLTFIIQSSEFACPSHSQPAMMSTANYKNKVKRGNLSSLFVIRKCYEFGMSYANFDEWCQIWMITSLADTATRHPSSYVHDVFRDGTPC